MNTTPEAAPYAFSRHEAGLLMAAVQGGQIERIAALRLFWQGNGTTALIRLFSQFIALANSVVANNREMLEFILVTEWDQHPHTAEKANLPTLLGALNGIWVADGVDPAPCCGGCAYRVGACANQSEITTADADYTVREQQPFMCHETLDDAGNPTTACRGWAQRMKQRRQAERGAA